MSKSVGLKIHERFVVGPCVHLNGTSKDGLRTPLEEAYFKLGEAYDAIRLCAPNGRDYYIGNVNLAEATRQHAERLMAVDAVRKSIEEEIDIIDSQDAR